MVRCKTCTRESPGISMDSLWDSGWITVGDLTGLNFGWVCPDCNGHSSSVSFIESKAKERKMKMNVATCRCKMRVDKVAHVKDDKGNTTLEVIDLRAVYGDTPENKEWSKWTPSATFHIQISNPAAIGKLSSGHEYFVDFIPVVPN